MKRTKIFLSSVITMIAVAGYSQTSGSGQGAFQPSGAGAQGGASQGGTGQGTTQPNPANPPGTTLPPGLEKREQLPPGLQGREQLPPGLQFRTNQTGRPFPEGPLQAGAATNNSGVATNQFGNTNLTRNQFANTNFTQTSRAGETNRVFSGTNSTPLLQDQAFTPADRQLLSRIRQAVVGQIRTVGIMAPVHFIVQEGVVTMVGVLPRDEERQRLLTVVQGIPGVVRVIDQIQVGGSAGASTGTGVQTTTGAGTGLQTTTGADAGVQTTTGVGANASLTNQFGAKFGTNFPPTSRTNAPNRIFGTNLPPGLQNRNQLPPGLQGETNFPPRRANQ